MIGGRWFEENDINAMCEPFRLRDHTACEAVQLPASGP